MPLLGKPIKWQGLVSAGYGILHFLPLLAIICCWYITGGFEYKGNFCEYGLYYTWVQMLLQIGPLLRLGSNVITDGTFTWVQLLHLCLLQGLLHVFVSPLLLPAFKNRFKFFWPGIIVW